MDHCAEKARLAEEFTRAAEAYATAARGLRMIIGDTVPVLEKIEKARIDCQKTRRALQAHMVKHRC